MTPNQAKKRQVIKKHQQITKILLYYHSLPNVFWVHKNIRPDDILLDFLPTVLLQNFGLICAVEEFAFKELHGNHSEDEHEEDVDYKDVENVLQRVHNTVKHSLKYKKKKYTDTFSKLYY